MSAAIGFNSLSYVQRKRRWKLYYVLYEGCYAVWLLVSTYGFFTVVYIEHPLPQLAFIVAVVRAFVSVGIGYCAPMFVFRLSGKPKRGQSFSILFAVGVVVMVIPSFILQSIRYNTIINYLYNGSLLVLTVFGLLSVRSRPTEYEQRRMLPFLHLSTVSYAMIISYGSFLIIIQANLSGALGVLAVGLFCLAWAILDILLVSRELTEKNAAEYNVVALQSEYGITEREREIVELLVLGWSHKEIAEKLCISLRTVETHVYNIYRKCAVGNKVELINLLR